MQLQNENGVQLKHFNAHSPQVHKFTNNFSIVCCKCTAKQHNAAMGLRLSTLSLIYHKE